ncbi:MAG: PAC2 family protein [Candidatus Nanoarchaeia archaeon]|jgi:uncharacterized protein
MPVAKELTPVNVVDKIKLVIKKGITFKNPVIIEGFQGVGLVGTLAAQYLSSKKDFETIGYVESEGIPPIALLVNGEIKNPIKILSNKNHDIIIIESELSIPRGIIYELSDEIAKWAKRIKAREIICLEGINVPESERDYEIFGMSTDKKIMASLIKKGVKKLENGIVIGMSAALLLKCKEYNLPATCLMVESRPELPDGLAAAAVLETLGKVHSFSIDVTDLKKQASVFEKKMQKVISHADHFKIDEGKNPNKTSIYG